MKRVVDGDTIVVHLGGRDERVRLIGIDTPETVDPRKPVQCFGKEASAHTHDLLPRARSCGSSVTSRRAIATTASSPTSTECPTGCSSTSRSPQDGYAEC